MIRGNLPPILPHLITIVYALYSVPKKCNTLGKCSIFGLISDHFLHYFPALPIIVTPFALGKYKLYLYCITLWGVKRWAHALNYKLYT